MEEKVCDASCKGCIYVGELSGLPCCNYLLQVGKIRPCPPGEGCTEWSSRKWEKRKKKAESIGLGC